MALDYSMIENWISGNSQKDSAMDEMSAQEKKAYQEKIKQLKEQGKTETQAMRIMEEERAKIRKYNEELRAQDQMAALKEQAEYAATLDERIWAQKKIKELELEEEKLKKIQDRYDRMAKAASDAINNTANGLFNSIKNAGSEYADYVERLEVGLIGSTKSYKSVSDKLERVFSMNVFFSLDSAIKKATEMVEKGINYNVELRSSLAVMSEKIAKTFDAFDTNLLRLIKIQQADSTQARLGMESLLQSYLNANFQNSEYLHGLSDQVSGALMEAMSTFKGDDAVNQAAEFEYAVQKWLGSFSSVGVSDNTISALAQAIGYLGSGDVSSLTGNQQLQQLMALSISKGSGERSYGDMLLNGISASDISDILTGFYNLVNEIGSSDNQVAMAQYAQIFGLSMSDIRSALNLTSENIKEISQDMASYNQMLGQVNKELSAGNLNARTSASQMIDNIKKNTLTAIGLDTANSLALNLIYEAIDQAANVVDMIDAGIEIDPFGVGTSIKIDSGALVRGTAALATYGAEWAKNIAGLSSVLSPNLGLLGGEKSYEVMGGQGLSSIVKSGQTSNQVSYASASTNTEKSNVYESLGKSTKAASSEIMNKDVDKEQEKMEDMAQTMKEIGDNVAFIVQLLNVSGIKIRGNSSSMDSASVSFANGQSSKSDPFGGGGY